MTESLPQLYLLHVPPQPRFDVPEQTLYACGPCGERFVHNAGIGQLVPVARLTGAYCQCRYSEICAEPTPGADE